MSRKLPLPDCSVAWFPLGTITVTVTLPGTGALSFRFFGSNEDKEEFVLRLDTLSDCFFQTLVSFTNEYIDLFSH